MANRPNDDAETWRDKYLLALDAQEQTEQQARAQYQMLRRALVQLSVVAEGQDPDLDELLDRIRPALRDQAGEALPELLAQLDHEVHGLEKRRGQFDGQIEQALGSLASGLRSMGVTSALKKELGHYLARLPARCQKISLYPALLEQLAQLQERALDELRDARPGLMQRLRGAGPAQQDLASEGLRVELGQVMQNLLKAVDREYVQQERIETLSARIAAEPPLREVPGVLEQIRELVMQAWLAANGVFAHYLDKVNTELTDIAQVLGGAVASESRRSRAQADIQDSLEQECQSLAGHVADARDLQQLKAQVTSQLGQIREALTRFQDPETQEGELTEQLTYLAKRIQVMEQEAESSRGKLREQRHKALHDSLTQLPNREAYEERVRHELQRWQRYGHPLTLAILDLDHFKKINDSFGHQAGDRVLKVISRAIQKRLREVDFFGRHGGEEFVILMPETSAADALGVLDKIRTAIADTSFHYREEPLAITLCIGIAEFQPGDTPDKVFARADKALYQAKAEGRNQCRLAS